MPDMKIIVSVLGAAIVLASCATPGPSSVQPSPVAIEQPMPAITEQQVTIGTLTDPCTLGLDDPWWIDHGGRVEFHRRCG